MSEEGSTAPRLFESPSAAAALDLLLYPSLPPEETGFIRDREGGTWAALVAGFFGEPVLSRTGAALRVVLLFVFMGALTSLLVYEIVSRH